jgi:transcriptional enhancer factor
MQLPLRGHPPTRYSPEGDYSYDHLNELLQESRRPLAESTGNAQAHKPGPLSLCQTSHLSLSPPLHPIPTPPILPTQSIASTYGTSFRTHRTLQRDVSLRESPMAHSSRGRNPIYSKKFFADYRAKVEQKSAEKEEPKWPMCLEDSFLDGKNPHIHSLPVQF